MHLLILMLAACSTDPDAPTRGCPYDPSLNLCVSPLTVPGPSWSETVLPPGATARCAPYAVCPEGSEARFALIEDYIEYAHAHFYDADGNHIASEYLTDDFNDGASCECDQQALPQWYGGPITDCPTWQTEIYALPTCAEDRIPTTSGELDRTGVLTGATTWDDAEAFRNSDCAGIAQYGDGHRALIRLGVAEHIETVGGTRGIDIFDADGSLVGTVDMDIRQGWGIVPDDCGIPNDTTPACGLSPSR